MNISRQRIAAVRRVVFSRRSLGRAVMTAAVVAAITSLVGIVVAWLLVGNLQGTARSTLFVVQDVVTTVDDTLNVADSILVTVDGSVETVRSSLSTLATSVEQGAAALEAVAQLSEDIPPNLDRIDDALGGLQSAADFVDDALVQLSTIPLGPDYDADQGLGQAVESVRADLQPIAADLRTTTDTLRELAGSSDELIGQLDELGADLAAIDQSIIESRGLIERYRSSAGRAGELAGQTRDDLTSNVFVSRVLIVILGVAIAVGQIAPFRIGRELAGRPAAPVLDDDGGDLPFGP